ncbi:MAG: nicotinate-nucleotide adenylyltransferase [Lewinellaceae bacterium]|nr:nicotinate-nucleotide adenylyltransferase [Lewinellaceae bacterium]
MKIGLFFGSFNPIHVGHLIIANYMATQTNLDRVWMVVSPHNPLKPKKSLAKDYDRLHLVRLGIDDNPLLEASNIEFNLPKPSYTVDTLAHLREKYPQQEFALIMGGDNLATLHLWKNYEQLLEQNDIYVYLRPGNDISRFANHPRIHLCTAPLLDISATYIRECLRDGKSVRYLVPEAVFHYLESSNLYRS